MGWQSISLGFYFVNRLLLNADHVSYIFIYQIKVSNSALISAFMTELEPDTPVTQVITMIFTRDSFGYLKFSPYYQLLLCHCSVIMIVCSCQPVH